MDNIINQLMYYIQNYFSGFSLVSGLIMLLVFYTTTKKIFRIISVILIVVGVVLFVPQIITGSPIMNFW